MTIIERKAIAILLRVATEILIKVVVGSKWGMSEDKVGELTADAIDFAKELEGGMS